MKMLVICLSNRHKAHNLKDKKSPGTPYKSENRTQFEYNRQTDSILESPDQESNNIIFRDDEIASESHLNVSIQHPRKLKEYGPSVMVTLTAIARSRTSSIHT